MNNTYSVERYHTEYEGVDYTGYINDVYAGRIQGYLRTEDTIDIHFSTLEEQFRGIKAVRAFNEIINVIQEDFKNIISRIDNKNNDALKIALSNGFHVIGTTVYDGNIAVELLRIREGS
jgi:hypothetical protein